MTQDLNHRLAEIRELQGKDPLPNPGIIQGFGPDQPPAPPPPPVSYGNVDDPDEMEEPIEWVVKKIDSPLVPRQEPRQGPQKPATAPNVPQPGPMPTLADYGVDLVVVQNEANFKGHTVVLTTEELARVVGVVLSALEREIADHRAQLIGVTGVTKEEKAFIAEVSAPRKRGRPRKS